MNHLLRKRALFSLSKKTVATLISSQSLASIPISSIVVLTYNNYVSNGTSEKFYRSMDLEVGFGLNGRLFHVSAGPLEFKTSSITQAEYAVDDLSYDEKFGGEKSDTEEGIEISKLNISKEIISSLSKKGITRLFPIQKAVLEPAMEGRDMIGRARTGTGKTLAFGIPILDKIIRFNEKHGRGRNPLALVMAPTRELARQVEKEFRESAPILDTLCVYGGVPISSQMRQLDYGVDVIVGTPGRIIDLLNRGSLNLSEVKFVVLDEADQMLNIGFEENVEEILQNIRQEHQTVMFSATMPTAIRKLAQKYLKNPLHIDLVGDSDQKLASGITLYSVAADMYGKPSILGPLITEHAKGGKCIIFTQRKRDADQLAYSMARSFKCEALHGDISQNQRERTLSGFRDGHFNILVATDVAARGLDIPNVDLVIHYELPNTSEIFVHRSGRTGRAGKKGSAILIHTEQEARAVKVIEREIGCKFNQLPRIAIEAGSQDMFGGMGGGLMGSRAGGRFGSIGDRSRNSGFGRSGGFGESSFGRSGGFGESSFRRSGDESSFGRSGGSSFNRSGGFGGSSFNRSGGSSFNRSGGFGGSSRFGSGFENSSSEKSGGFASVFGSYGGSEGSRFGKSHGFGDALSGDSSNSGSNKSTDFSNSASSLFGGSRSNSSGFGRFGSRGSSEE